MFKNISTILMLLFMPFLGIAQSVKPTYLGISPTHFFRNTFLLNLEMGIAKDKTINILPGVILKQNGSEKYQGFQAEIQPRFYLIHPSFDNMETKYGGTRLQPYVAPYYNFMSLNKEYSLTSFTPTGTITKEFERNTIAHGGGLIIGCRLNFTKNLYMDFNAGGGFRFTNIEDTVYAEDPNEFYYYDDFNIFDFDYSGITPKVGFTIGIRLN